jgi:hypothetical protein
MKILFVFLVVSFVWLFSGIGIASFGSIPAASSKTLVLIGSGLVGLALWGRRKLRR